MKTIKIRQTRHAGPCWRSRDELISDILLWTPSHGRAKAGWPAWTYIQQLYANMGCSPEDIPEAMDDRERWWCCIVIYIIIQHHNDTTSKTDAWINDAWRKTQEWRTHEDFFRKIFTSHFIARVRKGCWRFACERVLETEHKLHILTPLLWPSRCVFLVFLDAQPEVLGSTPSGLFRGSPRSGVAFPTTSRL